MKLNKYILGTLLAAMLTLQAETIELNFSNLKITEFVKMVSKITQKNILITEPINGNVDFISDHGIEKDQLFVLLQSILESKGYTLVGSNGFLKTVKLTDASKDAPPLSEGKIAQIHTQVIQVESSDANVLGAQVRFLLSKSGKIVVSKTNNAFIITDYPKNTRLIKELIAQLDQKKDQEIAFLPMEHVKVATIFTEFTNIVNSLYDQKIVQQKVGLFKNDATNMIIMVGKKAQLERLKSYLEILDKPDKVTKQRLAMIPLKNADAENVTKILTDIISKKTYPKDAIKPSVSADKELNSLIFIATGEEIEEFQQLLAELDRERQQVYVQARILEISKSDSDHLGVEYGLDSLAESSGNLYNLSANIGGSALPMSTVAAYANDYGLPVPNTSVGININFLLQNGAARTLSEPSLLCINNQESSIYVGQTESIVSGTTQGAQTTDLTQNTYTREDIGLTLKLTPRISNDKKVSLDVQTTLEDVVPGSTVGLPTTTKREVKTTAIVRHGERVIIGGLIRKKKTEEEKIIPLLGHIPLIGALFRNSYTLEDEVNLVVVLTPYIIDKSENLSTLREKLQKLNALEENFIDETLKNLKKKEDD